VQGIALALVVLGGIAHADVPASVTVSGRTIDNKTDEALPGVTVVAAGPVNEQVAITDENGRFDLVVPHGEIHLTYYYMESTLEQVELVGPLTTAIDLGAIRMPPPKPSSCCEIPFGREWFGIYGQPTFGQRFERSWPVVRQRDTDALRGLVADGAPGGVRIGGALRMTGAPALALGLIEEVTVATMRGDAPLPAGGGLDIDVRTGSNENRGIARIALGETTALEAGAGGPIVEDHAWWSAAAVLGDGMQQALATVAYMVGMDEQGETVALHTDAPSTPTGARVATPTAARDDWADTSWHSRFDDNKLQFVEGVTGERLERGDEVTTRIAGRAMLERYGKLLGRHQLRLGGELGGGDAGEIRHRDGSVYARDHYEPTYSVAIDAGVRYDWRAFSDSRAHVWQPHATLGWDWTQEGRGELFVTGARRATFDDRELGAWIGTPFARDDVTAGVRYELVDYWLAAVAGRATDAVGPRHTGVDASLDHRSDRFELHVTATTIERVVAGFAELTAVRGCDDALLVGAAGRLAISADPSVPASGIGASARWRHRSERRATTALGLEAFRDTLGSSARAVLGVDF
jgi:hypothetical protein